MKKLLFLICIASIISCESDITLPGTDTTPMLSNKRSLSEAIDIALRSLSLIEGQGSRSGGRTIDMDNIAYVCDRSTRAADNDTLMYIVNFDDNEGYAIVSANRNTEGLIAITEKGHLNSDCMTENPGLDIYLDNIKNQIKRVPPFIPDDGPEMFKKRIDTIDITYSSPKLITKWGQDWPYHIYCGGSQAGCAITAAAQISAYYEYPTSISLTFENATKPVEILDWTDIKEHKQTLYERGTHCTCSGPIYNRHRAVANLFRQYGQLTGTTYSHSNGGSTSNMRLFAMLRNFGYTVSQKLNPYPTTSDLVIVFAETSSGEGHIWLADGYWSFKTVCKEYSSKNMGFTWDLIYEAPNTTESYIHYNWGYDGFDDGYFLTNVSSVCPNDYHLLDEDAIDHYFEDNRTFDSNFKYYEVSR